MIVNNNVLVLVRDDQIHNNHHGSVCLVHGRWFMIMVPALLWTAIQKWNPHTSISIRRGRVGNVVVQGDPLVTLVTRQQWVEQLLTSTTSATTQHFTVAVRQLGAPWWTIRESVCSCFFTNLVNHHWPLYVSLLAAIILCKHKQEKQSIRFSNFWSLILISTKTITINY